jgi:hypothetical protein
VASSSLEHGGRAGQDEAKRGSPVRSGDSGAATDGGAKEVISVGWAPVIDDVCGELLQLEEGEG